MPVLQVGMFPAMRTDGVGVDFGCVGVDAANTGWRGTNEGEQLGRIGLITNQWLMATELMILALQPPGGMRYAQGSYGSAGSRGGGGSTGSTQSAWCRRLEDDESGIEIQHAAIQRVFNGTKTSRAHLRRSTELFVGLRRNLDGAVGSADLIGLLAEFDTNALQAWSLRVERRCYKAMIETVEIAGRCWFAENRGQQPIRTETLCLP